MNTYQNFYFAGQEYAHIWKDANSNPETQTDEALREAVMQEVALTEVAEDDVETAVIAFKAGFDSIKVDNMPTMLEVTVIRTVGSNEFDYRRFEQLVQIRGVDTLTPKTARIAIRIAFGGSSNATVYDKKAGYGYRVYDKSARKVKFDN